MQKYWRVNSREEGIIMSNERNIEITREMLEAVGLAQLYREDATLALRKIITAKLTSR